MEGKETIRISHISKYDGNATMKDWPVFSCSDSILSCFKTYLH